MISGWIVARAAALQGLPAAIREAVRAIDAGQPMVRLTTMDALLAGSTADRRFALVVFGAFGSIALVLAVTGLYGALALCAVIAATASVVPAVRAVSIDPAITLRAE